MKRGLINASPIFFDKITFSIEKALKPLKTTTHKVHPYKTKNSIKNQENLKPEKSFLFGSFLKFL